jgi:hypothetical protein
MIKNGCFTTPLVPGIVNLDEEHFSIPPLIFGLFYLGLFRGDKVLRLLINDRPD